MGERIVRNDEVAGSIPVISTTIKKNSFDTRKYIKAFFFFRDESEIVTFVNNEVRLDVNVSPSKDTVWFSLADMCLLFGRNKSVISRHIKNVILENNLDINQVVAKNATTGNDGKTYIVSFYNLDVIIPLGYKVHSQNEIMFRKWANSVLKEYLLKGYVINENRTLITNENYVNLINKVNSIDKRLSEIEKTNLEKKVFFDGEMFNAKSFTHIS